MSYHPPRSQLFFWLWTLSVYFGGRIRLFTQLFFLINPYQRPFFFLSRSTSETLALALAHYVPKLFPAFGVLTPRVGVFFSDRSHFQLSCPGGTQSVFLQHSSSPGTSCTPAVDVKHSYVSLFTPSPPLKNDVFPFHCSHSAINGTHQNERSVFNPSIEAF